MINLLTKIRDYVKLLLPDDQKPTFLSNALTDHKATTWEDASVVSSSVNIPTANEQPPEENKDKESDFIIEAFKSLSPEYLLIVSEMRNLLNSDLKKIVFHALATKLSVEEVAEHLGITPQEVKQIFQNAITDISLQSGFVRDHINSRIQKEREINQLKSRIQTLQTLLDEKEIKQPAPKKAPSKIPYTRQKALLNKPLTKCLNLEKRTINTCKVFDIYTLEDLLKFASTNGLAALKEHRYFGCISLSRLESELIRKGIFAPNGHCELYKEITKK
ncbi:MULTISPECIES: hypothetical protein [Parabacteroides]|uniref:hypothetical protein n=1 Tax=Parabacteroides leei TaxID=2939491 RepID=UPI00189C4EF4|nr:hypothetical protein [Parabacteroides goldsteinii]